MSTDLDVIEGGTMTTVQRWTGRETRALRHAVRMSIRDFALHMGVAERTISNWEAGGTGVVPRPEMQAALDTVLAKAGGEAHTRLASMLRPTEALTSGRPMEGLGLGAAAREEIASARRAAGLSTAEFADLLGRALGWQPTANDVARWETDATPPGDVVLALYRGMVVPAAKNDDSDRLSDLVAVYPNRSELTAQLPPHQLLAGAKNVSAVGLSLNMLAQGFADRRWHDLVAEGARVRCLFLDPKGSAIEAREAEEGFPAGQLSALTTINVETLLRVRASLPDDLQDQVELALYDETLRFNVVLVDDLCVAQPYLAESRGVDSPAFVIRRRQHCVGLYSLFEQIFETHWRRARQL
jgi:DNA-binding transcriptional regulator YiaG